DALRIAEHLALGRRAAGEAEAAVVDHQPVLVAVGVRAAYELGDLLADVVIYDDQWMRRAGKPGLRALEPAVQRHAVGGGDAYFEDVVGVRQRARLDLIERARAEDERLFERLEERRDAAGNHDGGHDSRSGDKDTARAHRRPGF